MLKTPDHNCTSLQGVPTTGVDPMVTACRRVGASEFQTSAGNWLAPPTVTYGALSPFAPSITPGSLGPVPLTANFYVEFTAPTSTRNPAGYGLNTQTCFLQFTATSVGISQPQYISGAGANAASAPFFGGEGLETQRARLVAGPITPCPI
jgi:hypothetical protein